MLCRPYEGSSGSANERARRQNTVEASVVQKLIEPNTTLSHTPRPTKNQANEAFHSLFGPHLELGLWLGVVFGSMKHCPRSRGSLIASPTSLIFVGPYARCIRSCVTSRALRSARLLAVSVNVTSRS